MSLLAAGLIGWIVWKVPDYPGHGADRRAAIAGVFAMPGIRPVLLVVFTWMLAHNVLYTDIAPFLASAAAWWANAAGFPSGPAPSPAVEQPACAEELPVLDGFAGACRKVDGVNLHYVTGAQGPAVLLVHGFGQTWCEWRQLMPLLTRNHTVVAPDLPGLGLFAPAVHILSQMLEFVRPTFIRIM